MYMWLRIIFCRILVYTDKYSTVTTPSVNRALAWLDTLLDTLAYDVQTTKQPFPPTNCLTTHQKTLLFCCCTLHRPHQITTINSFFSFSSRISEISYNYPKCLYIHHFLLLPFILSFSLGSNSYHSI